ncbi:coiled-coil domain-containing protein [Rickettsiella endosymbiont of Dermanyssus gallinae]|uniref:coiled-coil domain-containing protein n=1 Tax=Rickettsiella endosymbiont of Dermanyssus gallinae TaxID=2856608 RepID=UPI001C532BB7|nr:hypothetical protein [Rickettsiella endosymbiont of Dermanyssus gallinae]
MPPNNTDILVVEPAEFADSTDQLLQPNLSLWITNCLSMSATKQDMWTSDWIESLRAGLRGADSKTIVERFQQLAEQLNSLLTLKQQYSADDNSQDDWLSALLLLLLTMYVYRKNATECYPNQLIEFYQTMLWTKHADQMIATVPKAAYLHQLHQLVYKAIYKKPIDRTVDRALLRIQKHALNFYFKQFLDELGNTAQDRLRSDEKDSAYNHYTKMVGVLHVYIGEIENSSLKEKETAHLSKLLLEQLTQLIEKTSTLDLSPSWIERLKQWVQECISQLTSLYTTTPSAAKISYLQLLTISERLRKSTKKAARNKKLQSPELIREGCWLYFSLHEQLITQWVDKEKHASEYQSIALALFESFMSTFDWPNTFKKGVLGENPLKPSGRFIKFKEKILRHTARQEIPLEDWKSLVDPALNKLCADFFIQDWFEYHGYPKKGSFLQWLLCRQEPRLMAKIKEYISTEEREFQKNEIPFFDKRNLYRLVQEIHKDFCTDLNQITQMILSVWFQKIGRIVPHADLANSLLKPGRWLYQKNQEPVIWTEDSIPKLALLMLQAVERLGAGFYFFPPFQKRWFEFQEVLDAHSGNAVEFVHQYDAKIAGIIKELLLMFHLDKKSEVHRNDALLKEQSQYYLGQIKSVKNDLQKFREQNPNELKNSDAERAADSLLMHLKNLALDCMHYHINRMQWSVYMFSLSPDELQAYSEETRQHINERKQMDATTAQTRKNTKEAEARIKENQARIKENQARIKENQARIKENQARIKENQARIKENLAEIEHLKALLAEPEQNTPPPVTVTASPAAFFSVPTTYQTSTDVKNLVVAKYPLGS